MEHVRTFRRTIHLSIGGIVAISAVNPPLAQAPDTAAFEVASVKPNRSGDNRIMIGIQPGGSFRATGAPLRELVGMAYGTPQPLSAFTCGMRMFPGSFSGGSATMTQLTNALARSVSRTVVDQTGLTGNYDVDLQWTSDQMPQGLRGDPPPGAPPLPAIDPNGPSIFTAVQEQLGLKLESTKGPVDVLVIDRAEQPTPD
jgi:hypothetical protein